MSQLDDFEVDNENEDKIDGAEDYEIKTVDADEFIDPSVNDNLDLIGESVFPDLDVNFLAQGNREIEDE